VLSNCVHRNNPACQSSVAALLDAKDVGLQSRQVGTLIAIGVWLVGLASAALTVVFSAGLGANATGSFHLPQTDIAQLQSATSASVLVFATATDDSNSMAVTALPTPFEYVMPPPRGYSQICSYISNFIHLQLLPLIKRLL
jgi:hypothetical protein